MTNPFIHLESKLKKEDFLERIKNIQQIRTNTLYRSLLPEDEREWLIVEELHKAINTAKFEFTSISWKIFAIEISKYLYTWLKNNDLQTIQKQIINWISALYASNETMQEYISENVYPPVLIEVKNVINNFYLKKLSHTITPIHSKTTTNQTNRTKYQMASLDYVNCHPPKHLKDPFIHRFKIKPSGFGIEYAPQIKIRAAYFTKLDWLLIVDRSQKKLEEYYKNDESMTISKIKTMLKEAENDTLNRAESDKDLWNKWLYNYKNYNNKSIYKLLKDDNPKGLVYLVRQRNSNNYKIGWTKKKASLSDRQVVEQRISSLQTGNPEPIDFIGCFIASSPKTEKTIHEYFKTKRKTGEWFLLTEDDCNKILSDDWRIQNNIF